MRNAALIVGELCLDVSAQISVQGETLTAFPHSTDIVADGTIAAVPGGTAWLFANALGSMTDLVPLIAAAVGTDLAGDLLATALSEQGFPATGIRRVTGTRTDIVSITSFPGTGRLLARPEEKITRTVQAWEWSRIADMVTAHDVRFAWISGYIFEGHGAAISESTRTLFGHLRDRAIPIVLDLVPHDFANKIGSVRHLEMDVGSIDVLVGEYLTLVGLGFAQTTPPGGDARSAMLDCAREVARGRAGAVIQHQTSISHYTLAVAGPQLSDGQVLDYKIPASGPRGLGDILAVQGLRLLGLA
jgi:sugar/nucleoside kinase (ribokinase family)